MENFGFDPLLGYFVIGTAGFSVGAALMLRNLTRNSLAFPLALVGVIAGAYGGLFGSRLLCVAGTKPSLLVDDPLRALAFWQGSLSWQGGVVLGCAVFLGVMKLARVPAWSNLGCCAPGLALAHAFARLSCVYRGCCYGAPTTLPWAIYSEQLHAHVHPTQIYSMICELLVAGFLQWQWRYPDRRKLLMPAYGVLLASHRFVTEAYRGTPAGFEIVSGLRFYQFVSVCLFLGSLFLLVVLSRRRMLVLAAGMCAAVLIFAAVEVSGANERPTVAEHAERFIPNARPARAQAFVPNDEEEIRPVYLVMTRSMFGAGLEEWVEKRERDGLDVIIGQWGNSPTREDLSDWIQERAGGVSTQTIKYILIVGDCGGPTESNAAWHMPSCRQSFGLERISYEHLSDMEYGDPDHDGGPDVPVGRLPVRNRAELTAVTDKILAHEYNPPGGNWLRAVIWTGAAGFDVEMRFLTERMSQQLPPQLQKILVDIDTSRQKPYEANTEPQRFLREVADPAAVSFVAGHGRYDRISTSSSEELPVYLKTADLPLLDAQNTLGPLFLLACRAGDFSGEEEEDRGPSLAEAFVRERYGPVAVFASSGETHPLTNYFMSKEMIVALQSRNETLGGYFIGALRNLYNEGYAPFQELAEGDELAQRLFMALPNTDELDTPGLLRHQCLSYCLLGDPASPMYLPD